MHNFDQLYPAIDRATNPPGRDFCWKSICVVQICLLIILSDGSPVLTATTDDLRPMSDNQAAVCIGASIQSS